MGRFLSSEEADGGGQAVLITAASPAPPSAVQTMGRRLRIAKVQFALVQTSSRRQEGALEFPELQLNKQLLPRPSQVTPKTTQTSG